MKKNILYSTWIDSPLGKLMLASDEKNLTGLWMEGQKYFGASLTENTIEKNGLAIFSAVQKWLDNYFAGKNPAISALPLAPTGSGFRKSVWDILCNIPYGKVITYGEIAALMAAKTNKQSMSSQAVGGAVGHNPISIIIPCHRVIGAGGNLTGYAGGIDKKIKLLELEGICF
jgi:methylated-DNA-[protein]-cysteine S-methyltransferase